VRRVRRGLRREQLCSGRLTLHRAIPALPLSREAQQYRRLLRTVGAYRLVIGQPRQDDLIRCVGEDAAWLRIDLTPPNSLDL